MSLSPGFDLRCMYAMNILPKTMQLYKPYDPIQYNNNHVQ